MDDGDLIKSGLGAIIGFALAQFVNVVKLGWDWWRKPKLKIEHSETNCLLSHTTALSSGEMAGEKYYGFEVRNTGWRVATGVQFQIVKIENEIEGGWAEMADTALVLSTYHGADAKTAETKATIIPGASVAVGLATWRQDHDTVIPLAYGIPDYYEEFCEGSKAYRFTVVAFEDNGYYVKAVLTVRPYENEPHRRPTSAEPHSND
jgi:hypothetical protein